MCPTQRKGDNLCAALFYGRFNQIQIIFSRTKDKTALKLFST